MQVVPANAADRPTFTTPTGNITCTVLGGSAVRCDITEKDWEPEPADLDPDCPTDGPVFGEIAPSENARLTCSGDSPAGTATLGTPATSWWRKSFGTAPGEQAVLPYGYVLVAGDVECTSARAGVSCHGPETGFFVSGGSYLLRNG